MFSSTIGAPVTFDPVSNFQANIPRGNVFIGKLPVFCKSPLAGYAKALAAQLNTKNKEMHSIIIIKDLDLFMIDSPPLINNQFKLYSMAF